MPRRTTTSNGTPIYKPLVKLGPLGLPKRQAQQVYAYRRLREGELLARSGGNPTGREKELLRQLVLRFRAGMYGRVLLEHHQRGKEKLTITQRIDTEKAIALADADVERLSEAIDRLRPDADPLMNSLLGSFDATKLRPAVSPRCGAQTEGKWSGSSKLPPSTPKSSGEEDPAAAPHPDPNSAEEVGEVPSSKPGIPPESQPPPENAPAVATTPDKPSLDPYAEIEAHNANEAIPRQETN
jgi:hypothetical protein